MSEFTCCFSDVVVDGGVLGRRERERESVQIYNLSYLFLIISKLGRREQVHRHHVNSSNPYLSNSSIIPSPEKTTSQFSQHPTQTHALTHSLYLPIYALQQQKRNTMTSSAWEILPLPSKSWRSPEALSHLHLNTSVPTPSPNDLGEKEVMVRIKAASINARDMMVIAHGTSCFPFPFPKPTPYNDSPQLELRN